MTIQKFKEMNAPEFADYLKSVPYLIYLRLKGDNFFIYSIEKCEEFDGIQWTSTTGDWNVLKVESTPKNLIQIFRKYKNYIFSNERSIVLT